MKVRPVVGAVVAPVLVALSMGSASASPVAGPGLKDLAQRQSKLLLKYFDGQNASPTRCGRGQGSDGSDVFLLPVLSFSPGDRTIRCTTSARSVFVDLGGALITEDDRFPESSYELDGTPVPFTPEYLAPICDDVIDQGYLGDARPATVDGRALTGPVLNSGLFSAPVNRSAQVPGGADYYADSVDVGHPGRLATVFCGYKAKVALRPGVHTIVVDYSTSFEGNPSTVFTFEVTVTR